MVVDNNWLMIVLFNFGMVGLLFFDDDGMWVFLF